MSMLNLKELDSMHLSVLAEIGNIGSGNAATALAGLLNTPVDIEVPNICLMDYSKAADYLGGADKTAIGMTVNVKGDMNGVMLQIVEQEFANRLINTFYEKNVDSIDSLDDMDLSVLREMANITTAAYVNSIAKMTNTFIDIEPPQNQLGTIGEILAVPEKEFTRLDYQVLFIDERLSFAHTQIKSAMILILEMDSMKVLFEGLGIDL